MVQVGSNGLSTSLVVRDAGKFVASMGRSGSWRASRLPITVALRDL
jgi:hypothetical protein